MLTPELKQEMWAIYTALGSEALQKSHYDLAEETEITDPKTWREFLLETDVRNYIDVEMNILQHTELNKIVSNVGNSRSVGQAQLLSALDKLNKTTTTKDGPVFIYSYVPLSNQQEKAPNIQKNETDIFLRRG